MQLNIAVFIAFAFGWSLTAAYAQTYSTGAVGIYSTCGDSDLRLAIPEAANVRSWFDSAGFSQVSRWENDDVWNTDFSDGPSNDMEPQGGSDVANVYFFAGHGICQNTPMLSSPDFISTCSGGVIQDTNIGMSSRWGNGGGNSQFMLLDGSCPMDLVSLESNWFPPFQGLHIATGHSGTENNDTRDSSFRGGEFAARTLGTFSIFEPFLIKIWLIPPLSVTWAWMETGLIDVDPQVCAVSVANDTTAETASNRRDNEFINQTWGRQSGDWFAWRWVCR
jgi:hypothetical protein